MSDFLDLQGAKDLNTDAIHIGAVANSIDPVTGAPIDTHVNRAGGTDYTLQGFWNALGPVKMPWTSVAGGTLTQPNQAFLHPANGNYYSWTGEYPVGGHVVAPGTDPTAVTGYVPRTDVGLRHELASSGGAGLVGFQQAGSGSVLRPAQDKIRERVTPHDFGAVGDGITNDQLAFNSIELLSSSAQVDLLGKTYLLTTLPVKRIYFNGRIKRASDGFIFDVPQTINVAAGNHNVLLGDGAGASYPYFVQYKGPNRGYANTAIGHDSQKSAVTARNNTSVGHGTLESLVEGRYNDAFGLFALYHVNSDDGADKRGTRNVGFGSQSLYFTTTGHSNVAVGRNAGSNITGFENVAVGSAALIGYPPLGLDDVTIENQIPINANYLTAVGQSAGRLSNCDGNTMVGANAGYNATISSVLAIGQDAARGVDRDKFYDGRQRDEVSLSGSYVWTGNTITVTVASHGVLDNNIVFIAVGSHEANYLTAVSVTANTFVINTPYTGNESGLVTISAVIRNNVLPKSDGIMAIGQKAMFQANNNANSVAVGWLSQYTSNGATNTTIGNFTLNANTTGSQNTGVGYSALRNNTTGNLNSAIGEFASSENLTGSARTALGKNALRSKQDATADTSFNNVTGVGANTRVSGDNQVQLGDAATTTYVYGTVQNRSDARDKTDISDTALGIEFIMGLRPVDGRWDMRDDYLEEYQVQIGVDDNAEPVFETRTRQLPKDGSKARSRKHHWFIAQEVKELCDKLGVEFGGYQDHSINGGCDVKTLGYDEFIPPITKAIQQCWQRMDDIERRLDKLDPPEVSS